METKHTPGPWISYLSFAPLDNGSKFSNGWISIKSPNHDTIELGECKIYPNAGLSMDEAEANAKLISAAPDMLEALYWAKAFGKNGDVHDKMILEKIEAAINKAILK